uniref:TCF3 fusion partner isoform X5 n=1 Tax=Nyctereutes procyonoides TaxID=34880 RepID=UPI0024443733|nr:TCF3 fusion partner isoform X5 [Nyctereutes procyonoides]
MQLLSLSPLKDRGLRLDVQGEKARSWSSESERQTRLEAPAPGSEWGLEVPAILGEQVWGTMAAVGFEEFSAPPGSELALPPLFGGHILESELETEVEFVSGGLGGSGLRERDEEEEAARGQRRRQRELNRRKYQVLGRRCREIEQVNERVLNRLHQVQRITRRLQQERRWPAHSGLSCPVNRAGSRCREVPWSGPASPAAQLLGNQVPHESAGCLWR